MINTKYKINVKLDVNQHVVEMFWLTSIHNNTCNYLLFKVRE